MKHQHSAFGFLGYNYLTSTEIFKVGVFSQWLEVSPLPLRMYDARAATVNDDIYILGIQHFPLIISLQLNHNIYHICQEDPSMLTKLKYLCSKIINGFQYLRSERKDLSMPCQQLVFLKTFKKFVSNFLSLGNYLLIIFIHFILQKRCVIIFLQTQN